MENYVQTQVSCIHCKKILSVKGLHTHYIASHTNQGRAKWSENSKKGGYSVIEKYKNLKKDVVANYLTAPNFCTQCSKAIPYESRKNKFCSRSCAATHNNLKSVGKRKFGPSKANNLTVTEKRKLKNNIVGEYSVVYRWSCKVCGKETVSKTAKKFCTKHSDHYSHNGRAKFWFTFRLFDYPDLFDFELLEKHGMRSRGQNNINGVVRDHKVSVADAIKNNYDPYYIKHPLNCELILNHDNAKKHKNSSISYEELVRQVDEYEKNLTRNSN